MIKIYLLIIFILSLINGCTSIKDSPYNRTSMPDKPPVEDRTVNSEDQHQPKVITTAALDRGTPMTRKKSSPPASREAVLDLLAQSKSAIEQYDYNSAENLLKRALRIEPGNAWLWHNMAVLKFYQQDYQQAIQQALKSNNLGKNNPQLKKNNSKVIKQSYIELGEPQKAQKY
ncbi:tetratricopeptide repeat protein [sulfur-oxidizing endosymbiont of Gigantopelta aegis]|uniref:tetratricopeptide repeat protein n=1 Tax=sulfur-oxidizing endosymbiont of Gigantopelta aegis TaxID=2794934 RepID=UPI0018DC8379|nr:tetratricopeptide repeat protein [sulfur-oxidizing endosymbiont of Gigantopelta aegis]